MTAMKLVSVTKLVILSKGTSKVMSTQYKTNDRYEKNPVTKLLFYVMRDQK